MIRTYRYSSLVLLMILSASASGAEDRLTVASVRSYSPSMDDGRCIPPLVTETEEFYEIQGNCEQELGQQLRRKGIVWKDGRKYDSITHWEVKWDYNYARESQSCSVDDFKVMVDIRYRYPKWSGSDTAPADLAGRWNAYLRNLAEHESLHGYKVVETAKEISRAVAELPPAATCADLNQVVRGICSEKVKQLRENQERYDAVTRHGAAQGAVFP